VQQAIGTSWLFEDTKDKAVEKLALIFWLVVSAAGAYGVNMLNLTKKIKTELRKLLHRKLTKVFAVD
jgi:hypothetical protein